MTKFLEEEYQNIITMAKKICKSHADSMDVAHFAIEQFMQHERAQELVDAGQAMSFLSGIIHRSFHSSTSQYHTLYRQKGRMHASDKIKDIDKDEEYDFETDQLVDSINGLLSDMQAHSIEMWFRAVLLEMWIDTPNFSELSRRTGIPRTSISQAVEEAKDWIKQQLNDRNN